MKLQSEEYSNKIKELLDFYGMIAKKNSTIDKELYTKFNVKRGLRNLDGTGVLVGLTDIGEVHAYIMDENEKVPVEGRLLYRGIDIMDLVNGFQNENRFGFEECSYLLLFGELPNENQLEDFKNLIIESRKLPEGFNRDIILKNPSRDIMNMLARSVLANYSFDSNPDSIDIENVVRQCIALISRLPIMAAHSYQAMLHYIKKHSLYIHAPQDELSTAENFLHMIRSNRKYTSSEAKILDLALVLHAEHGGGNNSSFTTHVVSSSGTDTYSAISAAIGSLKGPRHGGANIKVMDMMSEIKANVKDWTNEDEVYSYLVKILNKEAFDRSGLIYGIGHAVYTLSDPRCVLLKEQAEKLAAEKDSMSEFTLYTLVEKLAPVAFHDVKKINKILCANVDFYSGFVYSMLNIPRELYTPLFAVSRIPGWCAHRIEEIIHGGRIIRPAYKSVSGRKKYLEMKDRK